MSDWAVLGLDGDPCPGDPGRTRDLAGRLRGAAELAEHNTARLRAVAAGGGDLRMQGDYAPKFLEVLGGLPEELAKLGVAFRGAEQALSGFASGLEQAKTQAGSALRQGRDADVQFQGAVRQVQALLPPDRAAMVVSGRHLNESLLETAIADLDEGTKVEARAAVRRARFAEQDRDRAARLASDAARLRGDAATRCVQGINAALDNSGIKNKSWWEKAWDTVSAPFRSWDAFVELCGNIAMVVGIAAMFISGPIGWALMATALVAGAVMMGDTLAKFAQGKAGLGDLAFAALGLIPGARGAVSLAKLGRGAAGLARGIGAGGGRAVVGALRTGATRAGQSIRGAVTNVRDKAVAMVKRPCKADPVDVATGEMVQQQTDVELLASLPLVLTRTHVSSYRVGRWFGFTWASTLDQRLEIDPTGVCYAAEDGMLLIYPTPIPGGDPVLPEEGPRRPLTRTTDGRYLLTDPDTGRTLHFTPDPTDPAVQLLAGVSDRNNHRIDLTYDPEGVLTQIAHTGGYRIAVDTTGGLITALRLVGADRGADLTLIRYGYDDRGRLVEVINSSGRPLRFDYDDQGRVIRWTDRNATSYDYTYDAAGRCVRTAGSGGCLDAAFAYHHDSALDADGAVTVMTDSLGHATTFHLNAARQVVREVNPLGQVIVSEWDRYDRLLSRTDPLGRTTSYTYDDNGDLTVVTRPDGSRTRLEYGGPGLPVTITEPGGAVWRQVYDRQGNLIMGTDPAGATTTYTYDQHGHLTTVADALGHTRQVQTNPAGLPVAVTDPLGATTGYERDGFGRVITRTDPVGGVTRFGWTLEGRPAWRTRPDGAIERWTYDGEGNLIDYLDPLGQATRIEYTHFDLPAAHVTPDGARLEFGYDTELRLTTVTNPQGRVWRYQYDPAGNLTTETDFTNRTLRYAHDPAGQLVRRTNGAGEITHYTRDLLGNTIEQRAGDTVTTFDYDPAGRLVRAVNPDAELRFDRDPLGRVRAETCNGRTVTSRYDPLGRRISRRTPTGAESTWDYNPNHQPTVLRTAGQTIHFTHDLVGRETERHLGPGSVLTQTWDPTHQMLSQTLSQSDILDTAESAQPESGRQSRLVQRRSYTYRPDGYLTSIDDHLSGTRRFDLDPAGRVTTVHGPGWTEKYAYDPAGNIAHATWPAPGDSADTEAQGDREYTGTLIRRAGNVRYQHDTQGRITQRQHKTPSAKSRTWHYTWDSDDRLTTVTTPDGQRWRYRYDPLGRRIAKQRLAADGATVLEQIDFTWDGTTLAEQTHTETLRTTTWNWEPGTFRPVSQTERTPLRDAPQDWVDQQFYAIVTDLVGTPTELVDPDGTIAWHARTTLWGTTLRGATQPGAPGDADCPLRFPGQYHDPETRLHYNYFRYYDPTTARYHTTDPLGLAPSPNPHTYVPNPTRVIDPLGLMGCENGSTFYRGARPGEKPNFSPRPNEYRVDPSTGTVRETHGVSVFDNPASVSSRNFVPHEIDPSSLSDELRIIQRGQDPRHYEIVPAPGSALTPERYVELLGRIRTR